MDTTFDRAGRRVHPTDLIAAARDFPDAIERLITAHRYERAHDAGDQDFWAEQTRLARQAANIYHAHVTAARAAAAAEMRASGINPEIVAALETGDWSLMAF